MSSLIEVESWRVKPGVETGHDQMIRNWFAFVRTHQTDLFPEWKSARYYREIDHDTNEPSGRYVMLFEYRSAEARLAYKERRKDWSGPYAEYKTVDPYHEFFDLESVDLTFWEPAEEELWLAFD